MRYGSALLHILFFLFRDHPSRASCRVLKKLLICAKLLFVEATNLLRPSMYDAAVATVRLLVVSLLRGCKAQCKNV